MVSGNSYQVKCSYSLRRSTKKLILIKLRLKSHSNFGGGVHRRDFSLFRMTFTNSRSVELLSHILKKLDNWEPPTGLIKYKPHALDTDIIITTAPKSGTILTQYMSYLIVIECGKAQGTDFKNIYFVSPWLEYHDVTKIPLPSPENYCPRILKSHATRILFTKLDLTQVKHIVVIRSPFDNPSSRLNMVYSSATTDYTTDKDAVGK